MTVRWTSGGGSNGNRNAGTPSTPSSSTGSRSSASRPPYGRRRPVQRRPKAERGPQASTRPRRRPAYRKREGNLDVVSGKHTELVVAPVTGEETSVRLGVWLNTVKSRQGTLTPERAEALNELGLRWRWQWARMRNGGGQPGFLEGSRAGGVKGGGCLPTRRVGR
ncbi:helicase associated domain-containing protein [Streptomyces sp. NPDC004134]|uniref:helicase associated domain-containing protein n=1 Tax=Streptomyces sp. NPDC004134 TaxID=3364691 RepID=UPI00368E4A6A